MRKLCSILMAFLIFMGVFAVGAAASDTPPPQDSPLINMAETLFLQRGVTSDRSVNLHYFEKLDSDDIFWEVESDWLFTIDNDGVITYHQFASFFGGMATVKALDAEGNLLGQTRVVVTWKWFYYLIVALPASLMGGNGWRWWNWLAVVVF